jgi:hypothetical protein
VAHNLTEDHEDDEEPENKKKRPNSDPGLGQQKITKYTDYCDSVSLYYISRIKLPPSFLSRREQQSSPRPSRR